MSVTAHPPPVPGADSAAAPAWLASLERDFPASDHAVGGGVVVRLRVCGTAQAPTIVLLHGIGSGSASWLPCALDLACDHRVIAWDAPGYGGSTPLPEASPRAEAYAARLEAALAALGVERCLLVGHSLGALVAAAHARAHPARLAGLVLLCPAGGYGALGREAERERVRYERLATLEALGIAGLAAARGPKLLRPDASAEARAWAQWNMAQLREPGYRQAIELLCGDDLPRHAPAPVPTWVHAGAEDTVTPPTKVRALAAAFGVAPAEVGEIPQAGHLCAIEQPRAVAARLRAVAAHAGQAGGRGAAPGGRR
jgi:pimeloyl-ACP methyl ester carboxylesterase